MSWGMKHQAVDLGLSPLAYIRLIFTLGCCWERRC